MIMRPVQRDLQGHRIYWLVYYIFLKYQVYFELFDRITFLCLIWQMQRAMLLEIKDIYGSHL